MLTTRVEDVTAQILKGTENLVGDVKRAAILENIKNLQVAEQAKAGEGKTIRVQELNSGYFYYLYETTMIRDVRVVYAPPQSIGFFGGDPDNFEWTRHDGDFTFLRAYVGPDGKPAPYSPNNVPFKPKKFLTISLAGLKENDFLMVLGYPGGTTRYRESQAVDYAENVNFPFIVDYLNAWVNALHKIGDTDEEKRIKMQADVFGLNNSIKAFEGGITAIHRAEVLKQKRDEEAKFTAWVNANPARKAKYGDVLANLAKISDEYYATGTRDRILRTLPRIDLMPVYKEILDAVSAARSGGSLSADKRTEIEAAFKGREPILEREMFRYFLNALNNLPANQKFAAAESVFGNAKGTERRKAEEAFVASIVDNDDFNSAAKIEALYSMSFNDLKAKYPNIVNFAAAQADERTAIAARTAKFNSEIDGQRLLYQKGMAEMKNVTPYPDANATLRFTYGSVKGYKPREAVTYTPFTTLKGVVEKDTGKDPFKVPEKLKELQQRHDFGRYGVGDTVPVDFLATTDIIGGNSGSPILNGNGEQVGIVFDGNYEGLGNDIFFSPDYGRTIAVDIRYVLFVTEKFGNAGWILNEMKIAGAKAKAAGE
jgi:Peptidase S46.